MTVIERLEELYLAGAVKRLHTVPVLQGQTDAEHVYGSLLIALELCELNGVYFGDRADVMTYLLYHDAAEVWTGDIPAPTKRFSRELRLAVGRMENEHSSGVGYQLPRLSLMGEGIVKASDTLDLMFKCVNEARLGNGTECLGVVMDNVVNYIKEQTHIKGVFDIVEHLIKEWLYARPERSAGRRYALSFADSALGLGRSEQDPVHGGADTPVRDASREEGG